MSEPLMPTGIERIEAARRRKIWRRVGLWGGLLVLAALAVYGTVKLFARPGAGGIPGVLSYPEVGREHVALSAPLPRPYNSNPPSSGAHFDSPANWGVYNYEVNDRIFIHNLEHGGVWISYRPNVPAAVVEELKTVVNKFGASKLVMAPRSANDADIAVVAWTHVLKINLSSGQLLPGDVKNIEDFYRAFKNKGPEFVPDFMAGIDPKTVQNLESGK